MKYGWINGRSSSTRYRKSYILLLLSFGMRCNEIGIGGKLDSNRKKRWVKQAEDFFQNGFGRWNTLVLVTVVFFYYEHWTNSVNTRERYLKKAIERPISDHATKPVYTLWIKHRCEKRINRFLSISIYYAHVICIEELLLYTLQCSSAYVFSLHSVQNLRFKRNSNIQHTTTTTIGIWRHSAAYQFYHQISNAPKRTKWKELGDKYCWHLGCIEANALVCIWWYEIKVNYYAIFRFDVCPCLFGSL